MLHQRTSPTLRRPPPFKAAFHSNCNLTVTPLYPACVKLAVVRLPQSRLRTPRSLPAHVS